jgi:predicted ATP-dependent endonuclease of OLD family
MQRAVVAAREFDRLIHIPSFREIRKEQGVGGVFNGHNVIAQLREMQNPPEGRDEDQETFGRIQQLVGDLIGVQAPNMEIRPSEDKILLRIYGNRLPLDSYGTGIHQLVILCAALAMYDNHVICIEEPEIHIHPELQRKFLQFISTKTTNRYFITTHSNVFLDFLPDINVYHVTHDGQKTTVTRTDASPQARNVLTDLGYKASDLLQANGIIWVEGPSDRIYLNKWIDLQDLEFVEGIHYAIMFYGGRLLAHISGKDDPADDLVELLRINSNALIVMDRDGGFSGARLSGTKKRIIKEFGKDNCWVTKGREIENYLSPELIDRYLSQCYETQIETSFGPDDHLLESIEAAAKGMKGAKIRPATSKVGLARELCELMAESDLEVLDLRKRLDKICKLIKVWNHMCG